MSLVVLDGAERIYLAQRSEPRDAAGYAAACEIDFRAMQPYLLPGSVLDIGCGLGGPTALIAQHCGGAVHLLDGSDWGKRQAGYGAQMDAYNSRDMTEAMLVANGVSRFTWWPVGARALPAVDNVVSLISWGWHYPVKTYLEPAVRALEPGARLILDLRPGKGGEAELAPYFAFVAEYQGFGKCCKTVWERK